MKEWLTCNAGKLALASKCRGAGGCKDIGAGLVACDVSVAEANDVCIGKSRACSLDASAVLECKDGRMVVETTCPSGKACRYATDAVACAAK
jgi:hypothetical protein